MKNPLVVLAFIISFAAGNAFAQDWPQWRGPNRDGKAADFKAPKTWPKELTQKWKVTVGEGVATPALVGDKLYVFAREDGKEVARCLNAADGKEVWQDSYEALGATGAAAQHSGPRCSPAVANGKVLTVGVRGMMSCLDAGTGKKLWRKDDFHAYPGFHPASSPMIINGMAIAQLGGRDNGAVVAYDLASGDEKWKWSGPSPAYASPALMTVGGTKLIIARTESKLVALNAADGKLAWEASGPPRGGGPGGPGGPGGGGGQGQGGGGQGGGGGMRGGGGGDRYSAATPIVDGQTIFIVGGGVKAVKLEKDGEKFTSKELWNNPDKSVSFNTPVLKNEMLFGLTGNNELFCIGAKDGKTLWSAPWPAVAAALFMPSGDGAVFSPTVFGLQADPAAPGNPGRRGGQGGPAGPGGGRRGGGGGMGGGGRGFGSIVDAGPVLLALTTSAQLIVLEPSDKELKQVVSYKVGNQPYSYPIASGNRIFIKDVNSVTLWTVD